MKRLLALLLVLGVFSTTVVVTGCGDTKKTDTKKDGTGEKEKKEKDK